MKIVTVLGARPQFIKAGSVSREIAKYDNIEEVIIHTGQHFDANMSEVFFREMKLAKPNYNLNINGLTHGAMTGQMIEKIEEILLLEKPDWVIVYGDTNSTLAAAIACSKIDVKLAHIEAGLRSYNMKMPEEVNRILTDRISDILFCPSRESVLNLEKEGYAHLNCEVVNSGDVMQDGANFYKNFSKKPNFNISGSYVLCTIHRAENTDDSEKLKNIFAALIEIANDHKVILPLHPRTKAKISEMNLNTKNIIVIDPVGYLEMLWLIDNCKLVMTDSGGLQKEAFFFGKYCITIRDETEWIELVEHKFNVLVKACKNKIIDAYNESSTYNNLDYNIDLYGNGLASKKIIDTLINSIQSESLND